MKMTEEQIIDLIARPENPDIGMPGVELIQHYAATLAAASVKLNRDELAELIAIGAGFYQIGFSVWKRGIDQPALFADLQKRKDEEGRR